MANISNTDCKWSYNWQNDCT